MNIESMIHVSSQTAPSLALDCKTLEALFDHCADRVYTVALALLQDANAAEAVVTEVFQQAASDVMPAEFDRCGLMAQMERMAYQYALARRRQNRSQCAQYSCPTAMSESEARGDNLIALYETGSAVHEAFNAVDPIDRGLIALAFLHGFDSHEIAMRTGLPSQAVTSRVRRGLERLPPV